MKKIFILVLSFLIIINSRAQNEKKITAAVTECIMLDLSAGFFPETNIYVPSVFSYFTKDQRLHFLDTILIELSDKYALTNIDILQKDSIVYINSSMKGIGKLRNNDWERTAGKKYNYYIKIYTDYTLGKASLLGAGINNTAQSRLAVYIAVFDSSGKRIWFPDAHIKGGIGLCIGSDPNKYYDSNLEKAAAYSELYRRAMGKIFRKQESPTVLTTQ